MLICPHVLALWPWCLETALTDGQSQDARDRQSLESHRWYVKLIPSSTSRAEDGITFGWLGPQGGEMAGGCYPSWEEVEGDDHDRWTRPAERKLGSPHTHRVTYRPLHLRGLSRPQIRKDWCSHNPFANVQRFKWGPILPQPKQISGIFHRPRPPWFGLRMWKTNLCSLKP